MTIRNVQPYLHFNGNCKEALAFYQQVFGATPGGLMHFDDVPGMPVPEGAAGLVMHTELLLGNTRILMSDVPPKSPVPFGHNVEIFVEIAETNLVDDTFAALSAGGSVVLPMADTFWGSRFGMLLDKFGVHWMLSSPLAKS